MSARDKRVEAAQLKVLFQVPFFAPGVARLPVVWDPGVETACTDGKEIRWNPAWFDKLEDQQVVTVLCHEVMHPMFGHLWRTPPGADHQLWNEACDHAVNNRLKEFSQAVMAKRLADPFPFPSENICCDPAFADVAEEEIYSRLNQRPKGKGGKGGSGQGSGGYKPFGQFQAGGAANQTSAQQKAAKSSWERTFVQACEMAKGRGDLTAGMARLVGELLDPKVPWWELLRQWLREQASDDYNWQKPNRYYSESEFILPILESERVGPVVFATDTSGSIDRDCLRHFQSEKQGCLDELRPSRLVDIYCDSAIHKVKEYRVGETIDQDAPGGGGTSFVPVFNHVAGLGETPKCLVYLTDLDGRFPEAVPDYPVLWVTWNESGKAPFGQVICVS